MIIEKGHNVENNLQKTTQLNKDIVTVYPNPSKNFVVFRKNDESSYSLYLSDIMGNIVYKKLGLEKTSCQVDICSLNPGIYFYTIISVNGKQYQGTILKQ
jgi:hypothetical protein